MVGGGTPSRVVLDAPRSVCLLRSRRTFLFNNILLGLDLILRTKNIAIQFNIMRQYRQQPPVPIPPGEGAGGNSFLSGPSGEQASVILHRYCTQLSAQVKLQTEKSPAFSLGVKLFDTMTSTKMCSCNICNSHEILLAYKFSCRGFKLPVKMKYIISIVIIIIIIVIIYSEMIGHLQE